MGAGIGALLICFLLLAIFGSDIAANTPGMSLAEAQILANVDEIIKKL